MQIRKKRMLRSRTLLCCASHLYYHLVSSSSKQEAHVRTKGHLLHHLACHSLSIFLFLLHISQIHKEIKAPWSVLLHSQVVYFVVVYIEPCLLSSPAPQSDKKKHPSAAWVILKYLSWVPWDVWLPASSLRCSTGEATLRRSKGSFLFTDSCLYFSLILDRSCFHCCQVQCVWRFQRVIWSNTTKEGELGIYHICRWSIIHAVFEGETPPSKLRQSNIMHTDL